MRVFWLSLGGLSVGLGVIGAALPLLPTVPFLLLAAFSFARSSPRLHAWLIEHPRLGPPIRDWQDTGSIRRRVKWVSTLTLFAAFAIALAGGMPGWALAIQVACLSGAGVFIWTRPEPAMAKSP
ncbi:MAG: YbaN family protein [Pseudomonadota bacterium]